MNQLPLDFEALARNTDPVSSHIAAEKVTQSGSLAIQCEMVLDYVRGYPDKTSKALSLIAFDDGHGDKGELRTLFGRRLPDLRRKGLVTSTDQPSGMTWKLTSSG